MPAISRRSAEKPGFRFHTPRLRRRSALDRAAEHDTGITLFTPDGHKDRIGTFLPASFFCDNVQKTWEELCGRGVVFDGPPKEEILGLLCDSGDPDNNQILVSFW